MIALPSFMTNLSVLLVTLLMSFKLPAQEKSTETDAMLSASDQMCTSLPKKTVPANPQHSTGDLRIIEKILMHDAINNTKTEIDAVLASLQRNSSREKALPFEEEDKKKLANLTLPEHNAYLTRLEIRILDYLKSDQKDFHALFERVRTSAMKLARARQFPVGAIERMSNVKLFDYSRINDSDQAQIKSGCGLNGLSANAYFENFDGNDVIVFCPGLILSNSSSMHGVRLNSYFIGHELGHSVDINKLGYDAYGSFLDCIELNHQNDFRQEEALARQNSFRIAKKAENANATYTDKMMAAFQKRNDQHYDARITSLLYIYKDRPTSSFRSNLYAQEITADIFGFAALAGEMNSLSSQQEKMKFWSEFLDYRAKDSIETSITHPTISLRNLIGLGSDEIQKALGCRTNEFQKRYHCPL